MPLFALLQLRLLDYAVIALLIVAVHSCLPSPRDPRPELRRLRRRLDLLMAHQGIEVPSRVSTEVQTLARDPRRKIEAIRLHRDQTQCGLAEAKEDVEDFIAEWKASSKG